MSLSGFVFTLQVVLFLSVSYAILGRILLNVSTVVLCSVLMLMRVLVRMLMAVLVIVAMMMTTMALVTTLRRARR